MLSQRTNFLSKSLDKIQSRDEKCKVTDPDGFLNKAKQGIKRSLANAYLDHRSSWSNNRKRRETNQSKKYNISCQQIRHMGSAVSSLTNDEILSITDDVLIECIDAFGSISDFNPERIKQIAQRYITVR